MSALEDFKGAAEPGITPDDSPAMDEALQNENSFIPRQTGQQLVSTKPSGGNTYKQIELMLGNKYAFRYNVVSSKTEFKIRNKLRDPYVDMRDYDYHSILRELKLVDLPCSKDTLRTILSSDFVPKYDPFQEYVTGLPTWDGCTDHIGELAGTIRTTNDTLFGKYLRKWLVGMIASWVIPQVINQTVLILSGPQGIGKTKWLGRLIPAPLDKSVYTGNINVRDKDSLVKLSECPLIIMDELENMTGRNIDALKELITKENIYIRRAYAYTHENYVRRASFAGSVNGKDFLHDITGNRRFLCFEAKRIDYQHTIDMDMVFAQAYALYQRGFRFWTTSEDIVELDTHNEEFRAVCIEEEQLTSYYEPCSDDDPDAEFMMTSDILKNLLRLSGLRSLSEQKLGRVLNKLSFARLKKRGRYVYAVKLKPPQ